MRSNPSPSAKTLTPFIGFCCVFIGALCWGTSGFFVRQAAVDNPWEVAFWRSASMAVFVGALLNVTQGQRWLTQLMRLGWRVWAIAGIIGSMFILFIWAISLTTVANASLIACAEPMVAALLGWFFLRERLRMATWLALVVTLIGLGLIFGSALDVQAAGHNAWLGNTLAVVVNLLYATNLLLIRGAPADFSLLPAIVLAGVGSALVTLILAWPLAAPLSGVGWLSLMGTLQLGAGFMLVLTGARVLSMVQTSLLGLLEPITAPLWVWLAFAEAPSRYTLAGGALVLLTVVLHELWHLRVGTAPKTMPSKTAH